MNYFKLLFVLSFIFFVGCGSDSIKSTTTDDHPDTEIPLIVGLLTVSPAFIDTPNFNIILLDPLDGSILTLHKASACSDAPLGTATVTDNTAYAITSSALDSPGNYNYYVKYTPSDGGRTFCSSGMPYQLIGEPVLTLTSSSPSFSGTSPEISIAIENSIAGSLTLHPDATCGGSSLGSATVGSGSAPLTITAPMVSISGNHTYSVKYTLDTNAALICSGEVTYVLATPEVKIKTPTYKSAITGGDFPSANGVYSGSNANFIVQIASDLLTEGSTVNLYSDATCTTLLLGGTTPATKEVDLTMKETTEGSYSYYAKEVGSSGDLSLCSSAGSYNLIAPVLDLTTDQSASATSIALTITDFANIHDDGSSNTDANNLFLYFSESNDPFSPKCSDIRFDLGSAITGNVTGISVALPAGNQFAPKDSENIYRIWAQHEGIFDDDVTLKECFFTGVVFENTAPPSQLR